MQRQGIGLRSLHLQINPIAQNALVHAYPSIRPKLEGL